MAAGQMRGDLREDGQRPGEGDRGDGPSVRRPALDKSQDELYYYARTRGQVGSCSRSTPSDPLPLYAQLERAIRVAIATGRLRRGDKLPTVRQLAVDLRINANTVAKVYGELERAGVLETQRGVGTFVQEAGDGAASLRRARAPVDRARRCASWARRRRSASRPTRRWHLVKNRCINMKRGKSDG